MKRFVVVDFAYIFSMFDPRKNSSHFVFHTFPNVDVLLKRNGIGFILESSYRYSRQALLQRDALWETVEDHIADKNMWAVVSLHPLRYFGDDSNDWHGLEMYSNMVTEEADVYLGQKLKEIGEDDVSDFIYTRWMTPTSMLMEKTIFN